MFGAIAEDRHSLLLAAGLALAAAYLAGGVCVAAGLDAALTEQASRFEAGPRLAFLGDSPLAAAALPAVAPPQSAVLRIASLRDADGGAWTAACVATSGAGLAVGEVGLGRAVRPASVRLADGTVLGRRVPSGAFPQGWLLVPCAALTGAGIAFLVPEGADAPPDATVVPLSALQSFVVAGAGGLLAGLTLLVLATSVVAVVLSATLTTSALDARAHDIHLLRAIGASRGALNGVAARWLATVVATGLVAGAALGIVAAHAVFSFGNRFGIRAPVVPTPDAAVLAWSLGALGLAALAGGMIAASRVVRRLEGARLEAA